MPVTVYDTAKVPIECRAPECGDVSLCLIRESLRRTMKSHVPTAVSQSISARNNGGRRSERRPRITRPSFSRKANSTFDAKAEAACNSG